SYDQMSVSTECSFRTESDWDPHDTGSVISLDMAQPNSPTSPSKFFKSSDEKKGVFDRISSFFNTKRKRSQSRQLSDASNDGSSASSPASPLSPRSPQAPEEDGLKTPTPSRKDSEATGPEVLVHGSSPSPSGASLLTDEGVLPFADSDSSGRSSVREVHVCRVSTASGERNSGNVTPTPSDLAASAYPNADFSSEPGLTESVVVEVSKRLQVHLEETIVKNSEGSSGDLTVGHTTLRSFEIPLSKTSKAPKSPNLTSISFESKKNSLKSEGTLGVTLDTSSRSSSTSDPIEPPQDAGDSLDMERRNSTARGKSQRSTSGPSGETATTTGRPSPERAEAPRSASPVQLHKAIWVETHLGGEEEWEGGREREREGEGEGENDRDVMKGREEGFRADSPPVLAIPVTVIPVEDSFTQGAPDSPSTPSETLASSGREPESAVSLAPISGEFQTNSTQPEQPDVGPDSSKSRVQDSQEIRVTRKTVKLPSKHKVSAQKPSSDVSEQAERHPERDKFSRDSTSKTSETTEEKLPPSLENINAATKEAKHEPTTTTDYITDSDSNTHVPLAKQISPKTDPEASELDDTSATSDMHRPKPQAGASGLRGQGANQAAPPKRGVKAVAEIRLTTASRAKSPSSSVGSKAKNVTANGKGSIESTKVGASSDVPSQKEHRDEKTISVSPTLKDQATPGSTSSPSGTTSSKSRIPKKSTSDMDLKSPVTPDKPSVADVSGSVVSSKPQRPAKPKEILLKYTAAKTKVGRKSSFEEGKGEKAPSGEISPTKAPSRTIPKLTKEKSVEDYVKLVNGLEKSHEERSINVTQPTDRDNADVKKRGQAHLESSVSMTPKTRLPISSPARKKNDEIPQTSGTDCKKIVGETEPGISSMSSVPASPEQQEITSPEESLAIEIQPLDSESPEKGSKLPTILPKHLSKRSISQEESDTPASCPSPPPTKREKAGSLKLRKQSDTLSATSKQSPKSPVRDTSDPSSSMSKLPMRRQKSPIKVNSRKLQDSPTRNSSTTSTSKQKSLLEDSKTAVKVSKNTVAVDTEPQDPVKDKTTDDRLSSQFDCKSVQRDILLVSSAVEEKQITKIDDQSSSCEIKTDKLAAIETSDLVKNITSPTAEEFSKIQTIQGDDAVITTNSQVKATPVTDPTPAAVPSSEVVKTIGAQLPVSQASNAETDSQGREHEAKVQTESESPPANAPHIESDVTTQESQAILPPESSQVKVNDKPMSEINQPISNINPDSIQEKSLSEPNRIVLARDIIPSHQDLMDTSAKPVVTDNIHRDIKTHSNQKSVVPSNASLKAADERVEIKRQSKRISR
ncbi:serine-rich adhesin for platelets-like, partial [Centroberyx affinis]|uniref:serine-rich adhesin for platelets-like n=1 Tax=Centroberyx affinis TaxID=166261 RepID=UPI003A5B9776